MREGNDPTDSPPSASRAALWIAAIYVLVSLVWIVASDRVVLLLTGNLSQSSRFQTFKGSFFVLATGVMLWILIARHLRRVADLHARLGERDTLARRLLEQAPIPIAVVQDGVLTFSNEIAQQLLDGGRLVGSRLEDRIAPASRAEVNHAIERTLAGDGKTTLREIGLLGPDGVELTMELTATIFATTPPAVQISLVDVTERKRLERITREAQKMEAVGTVAAQFTHEFNNVLTAIIGLTSLARTRVPADSDTRNTLDQIEDIGEHATGISRSLLTLCGPSPADKKIQPLRTLLDGAMQLVRGVTPSSISIQQDFSGIDGVYVEADAAQFRQILLNLAINARDAMPGGGTLSVSAFLAPGADDRPSALVRVQDSGQGIPPQILPRIFHPFFTTKPVGKGSGLGLAVTQGIVRDHGGDIAAASAPGQGAVFTITLPTLPAPSRPAAAPSRTKPVALDEQLVIVGEANAAVRAVVSESLRRARYTVIAATDASAVLDALSSHGRRCAALVLDVDLPGSSGAQCLSVARQMHPTMPCVLMSGVTRPTLPPALQNHTTFITKPFSMPDLNHALETVTQS